MNKSDKKKNPASEVQGELETCCGPSHPIYTSRDRFSPKSRIIRQWKSCDFCPTGKATEKACRGLFGTA